MEAIKSITNTSDLLKIMKILGFSNKYIKKIKEQISNIKKEENIAELLTKEENKIVKKLIKKIKEDYEEEEIQKAIETLNIKRDPKFIQFKSDMVKMLEIVYNTELVDIIENILKNGNISKKNKTIYQERLSQILDNDNQKEIKKNLLIFIHNFDIKDVYKYYTKGISEETEDIIKANQLLKKIIQDAEDNTKTNNNNNEKYLKKLDKQIEKLQTLLNKGNYLVKFEQSEDGIDDVNKYFTLSTPENFQQLKQAIINIKTGKNQNDFDSATMGLFITKHKKNFEIIKRKLVNTNKNGTKNGSFFSKVNQTNFDLSKYQIFTETQLDEQINRINKIKDNKYIKNKDIELKYIENNINCLHYSLVASEKLTENQKNILNNLKISGYVNSKTIQEVAKKLGIYIVKSYYTKEKALKHVTYGNKTHTKIEIAIFNNHYFCNDNININLAAAINWNIFKDNKRANEIYSIKNGKVHEYKNDFKNNSLKIIKILSENGAFVASNKLNNFCLYENEENSYDFTANDEMFYREIYPKNIDERKKIIYFADFEASTDGKKHKEYMISYSRLDKEEIHTIFNKYHNNGNIKTSCSKLFIDKMLEESNNNKDHNIIIYFHNLKYDMSFLMDSIKLQKITKKDGMIYSFKFNKNIEFRDSYKIISCKLEEFGGMFQFPKEENKEMFPYNYYNNFNVKNQYGNIIEAKNSLIKTGKDAEIFHQNLIKLNLIKPNTGLFDMRGYAKYYCERDVLLLKNGMKAMYEHVKNLSYEVLTNDEEKKKGKIIQTMDVFDYLTISSIANDLLIKFGCYEGVLNISGDYMDFIRQCIDGGTNASHFNQKISIIGKFIQDFDACSLYPSAMHRMEGFTIGKPKKLEQNQLNKEFLDTVSDYFIKINIKSVGVKWGIPNIFTKENGIKKFHNVDILDDEGKIKECIMYVGKIKFEDLVNFQKIEYEILEGVYFNEGFNPKVKELMRIIYDRRNHYKKLKNPIQVCFKLIMNSAYGKTITKSSDYTLKCIANKKFDNYYGNNSYKIKEFTEYNKFYLVKEKKSIRDHFCCPQVGVNVLDMSKRIMNEVQDVAYKNDIIIYYRDTDSMHILEDEVKTLCDKYKKEYNRELYGNDLGQFHNDFAFNDHSEIKSNTFITVGKKFYIDCLQGINNETGELEYSYHSRSKGINDSAKDNYCLDNNITQLELYQKLLNEESIEFNLVSNSKVMFKFIDGGVKSVDKFIRNVQFKGPVNNY